MFTRADPHQRRPREPERAGPTSGSQCRYFPCRCFALGSGISCQVFNGVHNPHGPVRSNSQPPVASPSNRLCAAKQLNADHAATKYAQMEIDILKSLSHPNVVALIDAVPLSDGKIALFMARCDGNLDQLLKRPANSLGLGAELLLSLVGQYSAGLRYLYEKGVCHRDIKPLNILYDVNAQQQPRFGRCDDQLIFKLADFGVAKQTSTATCTGTNDSGVLRSLVGTPEFLSPDVIRGRYGATADLWSAAVMLYLCVAGHLPFNARDFHSRFANYLMLLASSRKYKDIAAFCGSTDLSRVEFASNLPVYCQLFGRLRDVFEKLLRLMLSSALGHQPPAVAAVTGSSSTANNPLASLAVDVEKQQGPLSESKTKQAFSKFFDYVAAITNHCWFHVLDVSTMTLTVGHVSQAAFDSSSSSSDADLVQSVVAAVASAITTNHHDRQEQQQQQHRILLKINSPGTHNFNGLLCFDGGLTGLRNRFLSGTLTDCRKTLVICCSCPTVADDRGSIDHDGQQKNIARSRFDGLMNELFIRKALDSSRLPKATAQFMERWLHCINTGLLPAVAALRTAVAARLETARKTLAASALSDMLATPFQDDLDAVARLAGNSSGQTMFDQLQAMASCSRRAQALAEQLEVLSSVNPLAPPSSSSHSCSYAQHPGHKDAAQLVVAATNTTRAEINKCRVETVNEFLEAADAVILLAETTFRQLSTSLSKVDSVEQQLADFMKPNITNSASDLVPPPAITIPSSNSTNTSIDTIASSLSAVRTNPQVKQSLAVLLDSLNTLQGTIGKQAVTEQGQPPVNTNND